MIRQLASVKITVVCLFLLFVLTLWGTVAQVEHGLYAAQERYFFSFYFLVFDVIPFPGSQAVLWVLFVNLVASVLVHFSRMRHWRFIGLKMSHAGILVYFVAAFVVFHLSRESHVRLAESEGTNVSSSYHEWELGYWQEEGNQRHVTAVDVTNAKPGQEISLGDFQIKVEQFYLNAAAFKTGGNNRPAVTNDSGITLLERKDILKEREKNVAGGVFKVGNVRVLLYGAETRPTKVGEYYFALRHRRYPLPFTLKLKDFKADFHPGTNVAKSYESKVEVITPDAKRDVRIFMNNPLRHRDYTFYQASYDADASGRQYSTLAVVKNGGQFLPYIACFMVFFGLALHFMIAALSKRWGQTVGSDPGFITI